MESSIRRGEQEVDEESSSSSEVSQGESLSGSLPTNNDNASSSSVASQDESQDQGSPTDSSQPSSDPGITPSEVLPEGPTSVDDASAVEDEVIQGEALPSANNGNSISPEISEGESQPEKPTLPNVAQPPNEVAAEVTILPASEPVVTLKKIALILSGGGARGAFQVGAEKYARDVKGYHWDIIAGVSVGAMNGAMLAMHRYTRLLEIWDTISDSMVYTGGFNLFSLFNLLLGSKSFYGNEPLKKLMRQELEAGRILDDLHVGAVSLITGEYVQFTKEFLELPAAVLASASIPVVWPPVDISAEHSSMVDGGVRNITPIGDVLSLEPDEIVIINCSAEQPPQQPDASANVLSIGLRTLDIMQNEIFVNDMKEFLKINALVREAEGQGVVLHHPRTGRPLKYYPCQIIEPDIDLGGTLDFSQKSVQAALRAGVRRAREVLGRP
jgi:NTE family protein